MKQYTISQTNVIEDLTEFYCLTSDQMVTRGIRSNRKNISTLLKGLLEPKPLIRQLKFSVDPTHGKLPYLYMLTPAGVRFAEFELGIDPQKIKYTKSQSVFQKDYWHRVSSVWYHIAFQKWLDACGFQKHLFQYYFEYSGSQTKSNLIPLNQFVLLDGRKIIPDVACIFNTNERRFCYLGEISMGHDSKRVYEQNLAHSKAIAEGVPSKHFNYEKSCFILCVFPKKNSACMQSVMRRMKENSQLKHFKRHFLFKTLESIQTSFFGDWQFFTGETTTFISL